MGSSIKNFVFNKYTLLCLVIFVAVRLFFIFGFKTQYSDIFLYSQYAFEQAIASSNHMSLYDFHAKSVEEANKKNPGAAAASPIIEYPPVAVMWASLPNIFIAPNLALGVNEAYAQFTVEYYYIYKVFCLIVELICFFVMLYACTKIFGYKQSIVRAILLILLGFTLIHMFYDRMDIILGELVAVSLALLIASRNYLVSFIVLAISINFKLIPILLAPLWIIGTLPAGFFREILDKGNIAKSVTLILQRALVLLGLILLIALPFYLAYGIKAYEFFFYHGERGIQIESSYGALTLFINLFANIHTDIYKAFGADNISSDISGSLLAASTPLVVAAFLGACAFAAYLFLKEAKSMPKTAKQERGQSMASANPGIFVLLTGLFLSAAILFSKVFSPQYLLWILPLVMLFPYKSEKKLVSVLPVALLVLTNIVATIIYPYMYFSDIVTKTGQATALGIFLLIAKNLAFLSFAIALAFGAHSLLRARIGDEPGKALSTSK
jgi:hypothetical protein